MPKLTKEGLKRFNISFSKAKELGITDEDLVNIQVLGDDKFRVKITCPKCGPETKVEYGITNAINRKWELKDKHAKHKGKDAYISKVDKVNQYLSLSVRDGFDIFFKNRQTLVAKGDLQQSSYEKDIINFNGRLVRECKLLDKKIVEVTEDDAQDYIDLLNASTLLDSDKLLSVNTTNNAFALINKVFNFFKNTLKVINSNPFDEAKGKPRYKRKDKNYLATPDIQYVLDEVEKKNIRFKTFVNLHLETGLRIEEIAGLKYSDINRRRSTITINRNVIKSRVTNEIIVKEQLKTDHSGREITISDYSLGLIDSYCAFKRACGVVVAKDDFIFASWVDYGVVDPKRFTTEWKAFMKTLGYDSLPLENVRHSALTFMAQGTSNLEALRKRFGWSNQSVVMQTYHQSNLDDDRKLLDYFNEEFRNSLSLSYDEMFKICIGKFNSRRKLYDVMQMLLSKPVDKIDFERDLKICQDYLFELFPVFKKIAKISDELDDEEIEAIFVGFKPIYKKIKVEPISNIYLTRES